jgi:pyruvate kinase
MPETKPLRATKIVATIGPNAEKPGALARLLRAGVDVVRLNGAHCRPGDIRRRTALVRKAEALRPRPVGVLLDLGGPKIRLGRVDEGTVTLTAGEAVELTPRPVGASRPGGGRRFQVTYAALLSDIRPGSEVRINDGRVSLEVVASSRSALRAKVVVGGPVRTGAGVNFPRSALSAPALTAKDRRDLAEGLEAGVDFVGLSFVRSAAHVETLRRLLGRAARSRPWIVAKIERAEALADLDAIASAADALMVARGDLGVEIGLAAVPAAQRRILEAGRRFSKPVIVATQMLESMVESPVPTRAEVSDVAFAVLGGADAVMLSGETAVGRFPVEAVRTMAAIALEAGARGPDAAPLPALRPGDVAGAVSRAAALAARETQARAIVVYTESGRTATLASKLGLSVPIVALTPERAVARKAALLRDVFSFVIPRARTAEEMIRAGDRFLRKLAPFAGATIVEISGTSLSAGATNTVRVRRLG